jgi:putative oxidoreductase
MERHDKMLDTRTAPYGVFILRLTLGLLFLAHAWLKIFVFTPSGTAGFFSSIGLPGWLAYVAMIWEVVGGIALILGLWPRIAAIALVPILLGAIFAVHGSAGFFFDSAHGGWEYPALWIVNLVVITISGDGAYALRPSKA